jgi:crotonobetainyl-CoA:carnitine CoA-transferase CaiB-like acyl-CoA transferase
MSQRAAYAPIVHALSGFDRAFMAANGNASAPPASAIMIADVVAAVYAFGAIQTALYRREREGIGATIDATLIEAMLSVVGIQILEAQAPVPVAPKIFRPTPTRDGFAIVPLVSPRNYLALYPAIGRAAWCADPAFTSPGEGSPRTSAKSSARWRNGRRSAIRRRSSTSSPARACPAHRTARPARCSTTRISRSADRSRRCATRAANSPC